MKWTHKLMTHVKNKRVMENIRQRSMIGIVLMPLMSSFIFYSDGFNERNPDLFYWFILPIFLLGLIRLVHYFFYKKIGTYFPSSNAVCFLAEILLTSHIWGILFLVISTLQDEHQIHLIATITTTGLCAGGVLAYVPNLFVSFLFNFSLILPTAIKLLFSSDIRVLGFFFFFFSFYLVFIAYRGNKEYWHSLRSEKMLASQAAELELLSQVDVLTGIFNRRYFDDRFEQEWKRAVRNQSSISIVICDLDNFKHINDEYGHLAGDEVIRSTAKQLRSVFKRTTDIVCRYGGEEFVVIMATDYTEAASLANSVRKLQEETLVSYHKNLLRVTISIGIASTTPRHTESKNQLLADADSALYKAKRSGKNRVVSFGGI